MKPFPVLALLAFSLFGLIPPRAAPAADTKKALDVDKAKEALERLAGEARKALGRTEEKTPGVWPRSKETLALPKDDYLKRAEGALKTFDAEITSLAEGDSPLNNRDYFKTRLEALRQQLAYCQSELEALKTAAPLETFRVKQKKLDRVLVFLSDHTQAAKEEAGL